MTGYIFKLIIFPVILFLMQMFGLVVFASINEMIVLTIFLATAAQIREIFFLERGNFWLCNILDFISFGIVLYLCPRYLPGVNITVTAVAIGAFLISVAEFHLHRFLLNGGKVN